MPAATLLMLGFTLVPLAAEAHHAKEPRPFEPVLSAAERAYDHRHYERALEGLRTALGLATQDPNRVYIRFRIAQTLRRLRRYLRARNAFLRIARDFPRRPKAPRSRYEAARLLERRLGKPAQARAELKAILRRYPRSDASRRALWRLARSLARRDPHRAIAFLKGIYRHHRRSLGALAAYLAAGLYAVRLKAPDRAVGLYELIARRFPKHALRDDALWHAATLLCKMKHYRRALHHLRQLTATRREAWLIGSYNSNYLDRAALKIARIYLDDLSDPARGAAALRRFITTYPHSLRRIQARKLYVGALLRLGRRDDAETAFAELKRLFPDSRYTRQAEALLKANGKKR